MSMATATTTKPPARRTPLPEVWKHTHTIVDIPVMRVAQYFPKSAGMRPTATKWPLFYDQNWKIISPGGRRGKAIPYREPQPEPEPELQAEPEPVSVSEILNDTQLELLDVDVAQCVLRAAAWPLYAEATGYSETLNGCSATVLGKNENGDKIVNVCVPGRTGGNFVKVIVPKLIAFQIAEE